MAPAETPGERLRAARKARGLTQEQLADATGIARETINGYERDRKGIGEKNGPRLAVALGLDEDYFNGPKPPPPAELRKEVAELRAELEQVRAKVAQLEQAQAENLKQRSPGQGSRGASQA